MENKNDKNGLKQQVVDQLSKHLDDEEFLKLNEMEEVEGGACALGCIAACFWGRIVGDTDNGDDNGDDGSDNGEEGQP